MKIVHYYVKVTKDGRVVMGSLMARKQAPKDGGDWKMIDNCLQLCCGTPVVVTPPSPSNFTLTLTPGNIASVWSPVLGADTYKLERATDAAFTANLTVIQNTSATTASTASTPGTHYYYRLSTIADGVQSAFTYRDAIAT